MSNLERIESIYVLGSTTRDEINRIKTGFSEHIDRSPGSNVNFTAAIDAEYSYLGGTGINIATNLRQFCDKQIYLFSVIGGDNDDILQTLAKDDINSDFVIVRPEQHTSKAKGIIDKDENHIWLIEDSVTNGLSLQLPESVNSEKILAIIAPIRKAIFVQFLQWVIDNDVEYAFDPGMLLASLTENELVKGIKSSKWLIANSTEIEGVLKKSNLTLGKIRNMGIDVIVTHGSKGVVFYDKENEYKVSGFMSPGVVDTSGAGDAWRAAFWGSLIMGESLENSLKMANSWASFSVEKHGAIDNYPDMDRVRKRAGL